MTDVIVDEILSITNRQKVECVVILTKQLIQSMIYEILENYIMHNACATYKDMD